MSEKSELVARIEAHFKSITGGSGPVKVYADEAVSKFWPLIEAVKDGGCWCGTLMPGDGVCLICAALEELGMDIEDER